VPTLIRLLAPTACAAILLLGCDRSTPDPAAHAGGQPVSAAARGDDALLEAAFHDDRGFETMPAPKPGEWLAEFPEPGQTVAEYRASDPRGRTDARTRFAVLPIGPFTPEGERVVRLAAEWASIFLTMPVEVEAAVDLPGPPDRTAAWGDQYRTDRMLDQVVHPRLPADAVGLMGVTMADLYPDEDWNFVFGMATWRERIGVYSIARYFPGFGGTAVDEDAPDLALPRTMRIFVHEAGHMLGIRHCIEYRCVMNGCNSLPELDDSPLFLCPHDLEKLHGNLGFDVRERYRRLREFCQLQGLRDDAAWLDRRTAAIEVPAPSE